MAEQDHLSELTPRHHLGRVLIRAITLVIIGVMLPGGTAYAQADGADFLFGAPAGTLTFRAGHARPDASSDIFSFTTDELTLERGDFNGPALAIDLAFRLTRRLDLSIGTGHLFVKRRSELRDWVDTDDQPIEQTTSFNRVPLTAGLKFYPTSRGQFIGSLAWVPRQVAPYIGAGGGFVWYRFSQSGDFVDHNDHDIFHETYTSEGWARTGYLMAGLDLALSTQWSLNIEGRYSRASQDLGQDFVGFEPIDLSGLTTLVGIQYSFLGADDQEIFTI